MRRLFFLSLVVAVGCGDDDALPDASVDAAPRPDAGQVMCDPIPAPPSRTCTPEAEDYSPGADDMWPECVSDAGEYVRIEPTISSIQRVAAFEEIVTLLASPTPANFLMGRMIYQQEQGLDSRVVRRFDPRIAAPDGTDCTLDGVPAMQPDYCVGPARLQPTILEAFSEGAESGGAVAAAEVEAGILAFLYVSVFKEAFTCTTAAKDCDSTYAYYTGGEAARGGIGLAARVADASPEAHDRIWDALLGLRCWRDLDTADVAMDLAMRDRARAQLDRALSDGVAAVVRMHLSALCDGSGDANAEWAYVSTLGQVLLPSIEARGGAAVAFEEQIRRPARDVDVAILTDALDTLFPCP